jgi:hypothetical protein
VGEPTFELQNLDLVGGPSNIENQSFVNGQFSRTFTFVWYLKPRETGAAGVSDLRLPLGDREVTLPPRTIEVTEASPRAPARRDRRRSSLLEDLFGPGLQGPRGRRQIPAEPPSILLRARVEPDRPWSGDQATYTLDLLVERRRPGEGRARVESIFPRELPELAGFWSQEVPLPDSVRPEVVTLDGRTYWSQPVLERALFPLRTQELTIEAATLDLQVIFYQPTVFGEQPTLPDKMTVTSDPVIVRPRPLPTAPSGFSGLVVRDLRVRTDVEPAVLEPDEAATLAIILEAQGRLSGIADPELAEPEGLAVQPPEKHSSREVVRGRVRETRTWRWTLVPESEGRWSLPAVTWTYFDPRAGEYRTAESEPIRLAAAGPSTTDRPPAEDSPEPPAPDTTVTDAPRKAPPAERSPWPLPSWPLTTGALVGIAGLAALWGWLRSRRSASGRALVYRLRTLPDDSPRRTASAAEGAWRDYLHDLWDLPQGLPCRKWPEHLRAAGADTESARELVALMDDLHYLRYAPQLASADALRSQLLPRSKQILKRLG